MISRSVGFTVGLLVVAGLISPVAYAQGQRQGAAPAVVRADEAKVSAATFDVVIGRVRAAAVVRADEAKVSAATFDVVIGRVRAAAESGDWRQAGWVDPVIDGALVRLAEEARQATGDQDLVLPVKLADVRAGGGGGAGAGATAGRPGKVEGS